MGERLDPIYVGIDDCPRRYESDLLYASPIKEKQKKKKALQIAI